MDGPAYSLSCLQGEVGRACQPQGGPRAREGLLEPGGGWCGDALSALLCLPVLSSLCSFDTLTHKPPEASPRYPISLGLQEPNGWSLFTKKQLWGRLPRTLALKHPHQKSPSKVCPSAPGWDSEMSDSGSRKARASFPLVKMPPMHPDCNAKGPARPPGDCAVLPQGSLEDPADVPSSKGAEPLASPCGAGAVHPPPSSWTEGPRGPTLVC